MQRTISIVFSCFLVGVGSLVGCNDNRPHVAVKKDAEAEASAEASAEQNDSVIVKLAIQQLEAYNRADLDAFCACYHSDVRVFNGDEEKPSGIVEFKKRYADMFQNRKFGAEVSTRISLGRHCIDVERWWRDGGETGEVLVRYTEKDGLIGVVQFLR